MGKERWKGKLRRFGQLDSADQRLLLRAAGCLAIARVMLVRMSFEQLAQRLSDEPAAASANPDAELLRRVGFAVAVAARQVPWRSDCFPQCIAARMLLRRFGYASTIHFGVDRIGADGLDGHAWLTCDDTVVTGGAELDRYDEMHRFGA